MPLEFGLKDFIDIFLVALMLFYCYKVMKESRSLNVFFGVLIFVVFWLFVSQILEMKLLGSILDKLVSVGTLRKLCFNFILRMNSLPDNPVSPFNFR